MSVWDVLKMLLPIFIILGMLIGVLYFLKRNQFNLGGKSDLFNIKVIFTKTIMPKKYISFVRIGDKIMVLGISDNSFTLLKEMDWDDSYESKLNQNIKGKSFLELFKQNLQGK